MASGYGLAGQIDSYLKGKGSPMAGFGNVFVASGKKYGVDPRLVVGIAGAESTFGLHLFAPHNAWGWSVHTGKSFSSWPEAITTVTQGLGSGYISKGMTTPAEIVKHYAPASDGNDESIWSNNVASFMRELGASPVISTAKSVVRPPPPPRPKVPTATQLVNLAKSPAFQLPALRPSSAGIQNALISSLQLTAERGHVSPQEMLSGVLQGALQDRQTDEANQAQLDAYQAAIQAAQARAAPPAKSPSVPPATPPPTATPAPSPPSPSTTPANVSHWAHLASGADRAGVSTHQSVLDAVARIAQVHGSPLTITTGTNHNQYVLGHPGRQSQHWTGDAADIVYGHGTGPDNVDPALTRLGREALIAAGMPRAEAAKQSGGVFNVGGWNILFNTGEGGNHYNHLHVGV